MADKATPAVMASSAKQVRTGGQDDCPMSVVSNTPNTGADDLTVCVSAGDTDSSGHG